jgi:hypothetical protein
MVRRVQGLVRRPWRWLFEGCHTDRDTAAVVRAAGFSAVEARRAARRVQVVLAAAEDVRTPGE